MHSALGWFAQWTWFCSKFRCLWFLFGFLSLRSVSSFRSVPKLAACLFKAGSPLYSQGFWSFFLPLRRQGRLSCGELVDWTVVEIAVVGKVLWRHCLSRSSELFEAIWYGSYFIRSNEPFCWCNQFPCSSLLWSTLKLDTFVSVIEFAD